MDKKYKLGKKHPRENLYQVIALRDFGDVKAGDKGGWIESEYNLSHNDTCWVYDNAVVSGNARVFEDAIVFEKAWVFGEAEVYDRAEISGNAKVYNNACVYGFAEVSGDAQVSENAKVCETVFFSKNTTSKTKADSRKVVKEDKSQEKETKDQKGKKLEWIEYFTQICTVVASKSKDRSTKVGCIIVGPDNEIRATGYNGFVRGVNDEREDWHQRPKKYQVTAHAEKNAVCQAARIGTPLKGCTAYISLPPCTDCTTLLIQAGIKKIVVLDAPENWHSLDRWKEEFSISQEILDEAGIPIEFVKR